MTAIFARFARAESGATAVEYGLIASLIAVAIIASAALIGTNINAIFATVASHIGTS